MNGDSRSGSFQVFRVIRKILMPGLEEKGRSYLGESDGAHSGHEGRGRFFS